MAENRVRELRVRAGLSQTEVARRIGVSAPNISALEASQITAWPKLRRSLAQILKANQREIFPENGSEQASTVH